MRMRFLENFSIDLGGGKICLKIVLWLLTTSIHADPVLSLRVGNNQEQQDSSETLWSDSDDEVVQ